MSTGYLMDTALLLEQVPEVLRHSVRVAGLARQLAVEMKVSDPDSYALAGMMHDLGKIKWPHGFHDKKGLSEDEWVIIHKHPIDSGIMAKKIWPGISSQLLEMIVNHHERPDGKGTPNGVKNNSLPTLVLSVADVFDAMTRKRFYRTSIFSPFQVIEELARWAPLVIVNALANIVGASGIDTSKSDRKSSDTNTYEREQKAKVNLKNVRSCDFLTEKYYSNEPVYFCNSTYRLNNVQVAYCMSDKYYFCKEYMRLIAWDLGRKLNYV